MPRIIESLYAAKQMSLIPLLLLLLLLLRLEIWSCCWLLLLLLLLLLPLLLWPRPAPSSWQLAPCGL